MGNKRISIEQYNKEIDESLKDIELGNTVTHAEVKDYLLKLKNKCKSSNK